MKLAIFCLALAMMAIGSSASLSGTVRGTSVRCPGSVRRGGNAYILGSGSVFLRNRSSSTRGGYINLELCNSQGDCKREQDVYTVGPRDTHRQNVRTGLIATYNRYGTQQL